MALQDLKVLTISTVFPNPAEKDFGLFIQRRMSEVAKRTPVTVIAPVPLIEYGNPNRTFAPLGQIPRRRSDGAMEVFHPRFFYPPFGGYANAYFLYWQIRGCVHDLRREFNFDLIDAHFAHPEGIAASLLAAATGKPFLVTLRGNEINHAVFPRRRRAMAIAMRKAARVITVSERLRKFAINEGCDPARVIEIPNGIDGETFYPRDRVAARQEFGLDPATLFILSAGYLIERKGHHRVVEALGGLLERGVRAELLIAGGPGREGDFGEEIRKSVSRLKLGSRVRFLGPVKPDQLARLMSACDVFCLATSNEGWPNVVHEAMACGAPVVAADVGAIPEMIASDDYGIVAPFGNKDALIDALDAALSKSWNRATISKWALERSWEKVAEEVTELMKKVVREHRGKQGPGE